MRHIYLFLAVRLLAKQRLRTAAIFCGMLFSVYLLCSFSCFGYEFWRQVDTGTSQGSDATEGIFFLLVAAVLLLVVFCAVILLGNLFSLTFSQRWKSLSRLRALGADGKGLFIITMTETALLFGAAAPAGLMLAWLTGELSGIRFRQWFLFFPVIFALLFFVSCLCAVRPLSNALSGRSRAGRRRRRRVAVTFALAILLYVPAGYVIRTNLAVHEGELSMKYGISYGAAPQNEDDLAGALEECRRLEAGKRPGASLLYVLLFAGAEVKTDALTKELRGVLEKAGWKKQPVFSADAVFCFLEDAAYEGYVKDCGGEAAACGVFVNRYCNRSCWEADAKRSFEETAVLNQSDDREEAVCFYRLGEEGLPVRESRMTPELIADAPPDGMDFDGSLTMVYPLSQLQSVRTNDADIKRMQVCGKFEDDTEDTFLQLRARLGARAFGALRNTREITQEWFDSMHGLHAAMRAICALLFFIAVFNLFCMIVFCYMEQRRALAVLWSLGESPRGLFVHLIAEHLRGFFAALVIGGAASVFLCRMLYGIFSQVWQITFAFPWQQIDPIVLAALGAAAGAALADGCMLRCQDFLEDIRDIA